MSSRQRESLESVCSLIADCPHSTPVWTDTGFLVIRNQNIKNGKLDLSERSYTDHEHYLIRVRRAKPQFGDLILTREAPMGDVCMVPKGLECCVGQRQVLLRPNPKKVVPRFLLYAIQSPEVQHEISWSEGTGSTVSNIRIPVLQSIKIPLFPLNEQAGIAVLLGALDDRIALLRETNTTLEAIAQALFKSWFVDFDPVRAKQQGRAPEGMDETTAAFFPDSFEESELGLVPSGWKVKALGELCTVTIGGLWGKDTKEDAALVPAISLRGVDLENLRSLGFAKDAPIRWVKPAAMEKRRITENEVLVASSGAGPCGRPLWAGTAFETLYGMPVIFSNFVKRLDCGTASTAIYVDRLLADMRKSKEIWNYINGTSIPNLDDKLLLTTKKVVLPSDEILLVFEEIVRVIYLKLYSKKAHTLATLRDTLLPRLISGQLRLPEAEILAQEV